MQIPDVDYGEKYLSLEFKSHQERARRRMTQIVASELEPKSLLDVGCGPDPIAFSVDRYVGLEPSPALFELATKQNPNVLNENFESYQQRTWDFDLIVFSGVLHEQPCPEKWFEKLKQNSFSGKVYISVPNRQSLHRQIGAHMGAPLERPTDRAVFLKQPRQFDLDSLQEFADFVGLKVMTSGGYYLKPLNHNQMTELFKAPFVEKGYFEALFEMGKQLPELSSEIYLVGHF